MPMLSVVTPGRRISSTAAFGSEPASAVTGDLCLLNNAPFLSRYSGSAWVPWGNSMPLTPPVSAAFAWLNQGGATLSTTNGGIYLVGPAIAAINMRCRVKAIGASTQVTMGFAMSMFCANGTPPGGSAGGFALYESGTGKILHFKTSGLGTVEGSYGPGPTNLTTNAWTASQTFSANIMWFRMAIVGSNYLFSISGDGQNFNVFATIAKTTMFTAAADQWGFAVDALSAGADVGMSVFSWKET